MKIAFAGKGKVAALALAGVFTVVAVGYGAIPGSDGVIHGCYNAASNPSTVSGGMPVSQTTAESFSNWFCFGGRSCARGGRPPMSYS